MTIRVLVVDDDPWILRMVTATLQKRGFVVDTAREGRAALGKITQAPPDVLITDVMMPVMDGWTLVENLRQYPQLASLPVIFLTALGKDEGRLRALGLGPESYLAKPFRFEELEKRVTAALGRQESADASGTWSAARSGGHAAPSSPHPGASQSGGAPPPPAAPNQQSGVYAMPPPTQPSGVYPMPMPSQQSGAHPMPGPYPGYPGYPYPGYPPQPGYAQPGYPYPGYGYPPPPGPPPPGPQGHPAAPPAAAPPPATPTPAPAGPPSLGDEPPPGVRRPTRELQRQPTGEHPTPGPRHTTALNGKLEQLGLSSLLVMMEMERKDGVLSLKNGEGGMVGRIFLRAGQVVSSKLDGLKALGGDRKSVV